MPDDSRPVPAPEGLLEAPSAPWSWRSLECGHSVQVMPSQEGHTMQVFTAEPNCPCEPEVSWNEEGRIVITHKVFQ